MPPPPDSEIAPTGKLRFGMIGIHLLGGRAPKRAIVRDVDRPGVRIAAVRNHLSTLALSRILEHAELVTAETPDAAFALLRSGDSNAMASARSVLLQYSAKLPGSRVLEDRYGAQLLAMVVPKGQTRMARVY